MKIGVIGYGSIGKRHVNNLLGLGFKDIYLFREKNKGNDLNLKEYYDINLFLKNDFDFVIIANPTSLHFNYLKKLLRNNINVLVEKPVVNLYEESTALKPFLNDYNGIGMVGFNTRFHPCIQIAKNLLIENKIGKPIYAHFFIGQYLPDWRPDTDYTQSVSAIKKLGGGVASELIHEVDLAINLLGIPKGKVNSIIAKLSQLKIETEDIADYQYISNSDVLVNIQTNYLYRGYKRYFEILGSEANIYCDLFSSSLTITGDNNKSIEEFSFPKFQRNDMYLSMLKYYIECVNNKNQPNPSLHEGLVSLELIEKAKIENKII